MKAMLLIVLTAALFALGCEGNQNPVGLEKVDPTLYWGPCSPEQLARTPEPFKDQLNCHRD